MNQGIIELYRGLTGIPAKSEEDETFDRWDGVSDETLASRGIFTSNASVFTRSPRLILGNEPEHQHPVGLPVLLSFEESKMWVENKKFIRGAMPAIAVLQIPIDSLPSLNFQIIKTEYRREYALTLDALSSHISEEKVIRGECVLRGDLAPLRQYEIILRPVGMVDDEVDNSRGWYQTGSFGEGYTPSMRR